MGGGSPCPGPRFRVHRPCQDTDGSKTPAVETKGTTQKRTNEGAVDWILGVTRKKRAISGGVWLCSKAGVEQLGVGERNILLRKHASHSKQ
ncbi:hypothetical protein GW17_00001513 [Ensete ventricosum]|nr:hypothetical protein GW17_00001513 [Ensete ventricosum]